jgi:sugar fermentation stimulation protein A
MTQCNLLNKPTTKFLEGRFLKRYKRFFADFTFPTLDDQIQVAHLPNTGSMRGCLQAGSPCLVVAAVNPVRKLKWTLDALKVNENTWVGVNTQRPTEFVRNLLLQKIIPTWSLFQDWQSEVKINPATRIDFVLRSPNQLPHFIEIKNVTLCDEGMARFPDSVTERGTKHVNELSEMIQKGECTAEICFVVQRSDFTKFEAAEEIDPVYTEALKMGQSKGLKIRVLKVEWSPNGPHFVGEV